MLARLIALTLLVALVAPAHAGLPKFGRLTWTELSRTGRWSGGAPPEMLISTKAYHVSAPKAPRDKDFGPESGVWLKLERNNATQIPRMHAVLDHLGMGMLSGTGPGVQLTAANAAGPAPGGKGSVTVDGRIYAYRLKTDSDKAELEKESLISPAGSGAFFFPAVTRNGRTAFASKLSVGQEGVTYDMFSFDLTAPSPQPVQIPSIRGAYAAVSPSGEYLAWVGRGENGSQQIAVARLSDLQTITHRISAPSDRRINRPTWRGDSGAIAFASDWQSDPNKDNWDVYAIKLDAMSATAAPFDATNTVKISPGDGGQAVWPAWSADGRFIAYSYKPGTGGTAKYDVFVREVDPRENTPKDPQVKVSEQTSADMDAMWVSFYQDLSPPCLRVELMPTDSGVPNVLTLGNYDESVGNVQADGKPLAGTAFFSATGKHFTRGMATPLAGSTGPTGATTVPVPMMREQVTPEHGVYLGLHVSKTVPYANGTATKPLAKEVPTTGTMPGAGPYAGVQGFYVNKDARIVVKISAKDSQWRRLYPGTQNANQGDIPWSFPDQDGRASFPGYAPPYLPMMNREKVLEGEPGVAWWWEDAQFNVLGGENVAEYIPRYSNFDHDTSGQDEEKAKEKMLFFRVVANDLWRNRTELTIPVFVYTKEIDLRVLNFDGARKDLSKPTPRAGGR